MANGITLSIRLDDQQSLDALERLEAGSRDATALMDQIGASLVAAAVDRINITNASPDGVPWPKSLRAQLDGGKTLFKSGALSDSINSRASSDEVVVGTNVPYSAIHQLGGTITPKTSEKLRFTLADGRFAQVGSVTIPARPYLGISEEDEEEIGALTAAYFNHLLAGKE